MPLRANRGKVRGMMQFSDFPRLRLRVYLGPGDWVGPGKAELLEHIAETGSIAAAGRRMGMSYRRAWQLVETLNAMFRDPVVESSRGGVRGGGATLTKTGRAVLAAYRAAEAEARRAASDPLQDLRALLGPAGD
ncbi:molybdate transport system regulatory protein [Cribrihabitans marinus]|uniref:Molybdate transport system regulatory protein n=2 Tax=Cribrihabitans marinus TaxID=1227549 RepID=A0A1H7D220_9RHOB|nr:molybdate transport system regulatory protein [Cribrihabitans marinus]